MALTALFQPITLNDELTLPNRIAMAPLTRCMAGPGLVPTEQMAEYYGRRAEAGLIISEATIIRADAQGYPDVPGIFTTEQIEGWKKVTAKSACQWRQDLYAALARRSRCAFLFFRPTAGCAQCNSTRRHPATHA